MRVAETSIRDGLRHGVPLFVPTAALGVSFGVLAKPIMGTVAPVAMSVLVFSGGAQFAALSVLQASGTAGAAIVAGLLMNARWVPMSLAATASLRGGRARRPVEARTRRDLSRFLSAAARRGGADTAGTRGGRGRRRHRAGADDARS